MKLWQANLVSLRLGQNHRLDPVLDSKMNRHVLKNTSRKGVKRATSWVPLMLCSEAELYSLANSDYMFVETTANIRNRFFFIKHHSTPHILRKKIHKWLE